MYAGTSTIGLKEEHCAHGCHLLQLLSPTGNISCSYSKVTAWQVHQSPQDDENGMLFFAISIELKVNAFR